MRIFKIKKACETNKTEAMTNKNKLKSVVSSNKGN